MKMKRMNGGLALMLGLASTAAFAHPGMHHGAGFMAGLTHPPGGVDHLLAMVAVGLWAAQTGGRAVWGIPAAFVLLMVVGGLLGMAGFPLPLVEAGILASVLVLGLLIAGACRLPLPLAASMVGGFAVFHGFAHGAEMPPGASVMEYGLGFALASLLLHAAGIGLGKWTGRHGGLTRYAGLAIALGGAWLTIYA